MNHVVSCWSDSERTDTEKRKNCCGCSACENICPKHAIYMKYDMEGFLYPWIDENVCINCGACSRVCPVQNKDSVACGEYLHTYAGYSKDPTIISRCTSGGFATAASLKFVQEGGVVCGVQYAEDCIKAYYSIAKTAEEVRAFSSSKYVQSEKADIYIRVKALLDDEQKVLFIGCPCDVYAIKRFLRKEYDNFFTCEVVCMGVTSYRIAEEYKQIAEKKAGSRLVNINARSKERGWFVPHLEEKFENGSVRYSTLFGTYYGYGFQVYNRPSCLHCSFRGTNGVGDIRVGDFWGIKETDPYWNANGVSCIFVRNEKGGQLLSMLSKDEFLVFDTTYEIATESNMSSHRNKGEKFNQLREKFSEVFQERGLIQACVSTGNAPFWIKHYVPDQWHFALKKFYHRFVDKR